MGDISGGLETTNEYLPNFTPLERVALTAVGNLQRIMSSFYNCPVTVGIHASGTLPGVMIDDIRWNA